jgi:hypothetical protein
MNDIYIITGKNALKYCWIFQNTWVKCSKLFFSLKFYYSKRALSFLNHRFKINRGQNFAFLLGLRQICFEKLSLDREMTWQYLKKVLHWIANSKGIEPRNNFDSAVCKDSQTLQFSLLRIFNINGNLKRQLTIQLLILDFI